MSKATPCLVKNRRLLFLVVRTDVPRTRLCLVLVANFRLGAATKILLPTLTLLAVRSVTWFKLNLPNGVPRGIVLSESVVLEVGLFRTICLFISAICFFGVVTAFCRLTCRFKKATLRFGDLTKIFRPCRAFRTGIFRDALSRNFRGMSTARGLGEFGNV